MDLTQMMDELVIDLKVSLGTEISVTEATRCIERAVDDMSRHLPRERIYEHTWIEAVTDDRFTTPATSDPDKFVTATNGALVDTEDADILTLTTSWQDIPRPVIITVTDANTSILRFTIIVKGTDADGVYREERFYRQGGLVQTGKVYFYQIYEVEVNEIYGSDTNDTLEVGSGAADTAGKEIWIQLDNPIKPESEKIYSAASLSGTLYVRDTDYYMDYANGRICFTSAGSMVVATTYYANYSKAQMSIDISDIMPQLIRIVGVIYPVDKIPQQQVAFTIWENMLTIGSPRPKVSQEAMADKEHLAIYYEARHAPPTYVGSGSYPEHLDQVVLIGAAGYALLMEALQYEQQAATDLGEVRTTLGYLGIGGVGAAALTLVYKAIDDALDKVALYLETNLVADAGSATDNALSRLSEITDMEAFLRDLIIKLSDGSGAIADANAYLAEVDTTDLGDATDGAEKMLSTGHPLIDQLNDGKNVPEIYADYARANVQVAQGRTQAALGFLQEAAVRLSMLRSYIEEAGGWMRMGEDFIAEAQARIAEANVYLAEATQYQQAVANDLILSDRFRAEGQIRLAEFHRILESRAEYRKRVVSVPNRQPA